MEVILNYNQPICSEPQVHYPLDIFRLITLRGKSVLLCLNVLVACLALVEVHLVLANFQEDHHISQAVVAS